MENQVSKGIKYMLLASLLFAFMGAMAKELSDSMSSVEVVFLEMFWGIFYFNFIYKSPLKQLGGKFWLLVFRGVAGFVALLFFFL